MAGVWGKVFTAVGKGLSTFGKERGGTVGGLLDDIGNGISGLSDVLGVDAKPGTPREAGAQFGALVGGAIGAGNKEGEGVRS